jgi:hypothetical protein
MFPWPAPFRLEPWARRYLGHETSAVILHLRSCLPGRIRLEYILDWNLRQPFQHGMIQVTLPLLEQQDFARTPYRHPNENQQPLPKTPNEWPRLEIAQQPAQPETAGEYAQGDRECEASNPQTLSNVPLALRVRPAKVFVNCTGRVGRMRQSASIVWSSFGARVLLCRFEVFACRPMPSEPRPLQIRARTTKAAGPAPVRNASC